VSISYLLCKTFQPSSAADSSTNQLARFLFSRPDFQLRYFLREQKLS
jgi:hypothetical protein